MYKSKRIKHEEKISNMKGITLIALVITIIVLLILAGVALASVTGDYGLFRKAGEAAEAFDKESVRERVQLEVMGSYNEKGKLDRKELQDNIENHLKVKHEDIENTADGEMKFPMGDHNVTVDKDGFVWVDEEPDTSPSTEPSQEPEEPYLTAADIAADPGTYYGEKVTGYTELDDVEWKIFYSDGTNIYLTTDDYVTDTYLPSKNTNYTVTRGNSSYARAYHFGSIATDDTTLLGQYKTGAVNITDSVLKKFNNEFMTKYPSSTNNNMKAIAYMMDQSIWASPTAKLCNSTYADYVIGGVPLDMFFASYNQTHNSGQNKYQTRVPDGNINGYQISQDSGANWLTNYSGMIDTEDSLYCISDRTNANAAWLASPSAGGANSLIYVYYNGGVSWDTYDYTACGFRPLVRLKSEVRLSYSFEIIN